MKRPSLDIIILLLVLFPAFLLLSQYTSYVNDHPDARAFPLDDAWIHLTYARNLATHGRFSHHPDDPATSGSTAPLYTFLEAAGFLIIRNEYLLAKGLSILFYLGSIFLFFLTSKKTFRHCALATMILSSALAMDWRMLWSALSGMETSCFIFLLLAILYAAGSSGKKGILVAGVLCGIALWIRPESLIMTCLTVMIILGENMDGASTLPRKSRILIFAFAFLIPALGYVVFNYILSGAPLPNAYYAKGIFYRQFSRGEYIWDVAQFFIQPFRPFYSPPALLALAAFFFVSLYHSTRDLIRGTFGKHTILWIFPGLLILAYTWRIPLLFERGRYILPALPFLLLASGNALSPLIEKIQKGRTGNLVILVLVSVIYILQMASAVCHEFEYYVDCKYIYYRHVKTALWVKEHVPAGEKIAAHDIGALGYYSGHRILDLAGLATPGAAEILSEPEKQKGLLQRQNIHYLVIALDWRQLHPLLRILQREHLFPPREEYPPPFRPMEVFRIFPGDSAKAQKD